MTDLAAQGRSNRRRGADAERAVVKYLKSRGWPDTRRYLAGDGNQPGDLDWHPLFTVEVKDQASSLWPTWCRQTFTEAKAGTVPVVVRRERGVPDVGAWECRVHQITWEDTIGGWMPLCAPNWVDGEAWPGLPFGMFVAMVWELDHPDDRGAA